MNEILPFNNDMDELGGFLIYKNLHNLITLAISQI